MGIYIIIEQTVFDLIDGRGNLVSHLCQPFVFRTSSAHSKSAISDIGDDAVYLLNPQVLTEDGEWEAWSFAAWLPGAVRFPSFWDLILTFDLCLTDEVCPGTTRTSNTMQRAIAI